MHISSLKVSNYKSIHCPDEISLSKGFNIIVGKNNSGKTALAEASTLRIDDKPHRSEETIPHRGANHLESSEVQVELSLEGSEIRRLLVDRGRPFRVPMDSDENAKNRGERFLRVIEGSNEIHALIDGSGNVETEVSAPNGARIEVDLEGRTLEPTSTKSSNHQYPRILVEEVRKRIYQFDAERLGVGQCSMGDNDDLRSDSSNLAEVLHVLQSRNRVKFEHFNELVSRVLTNVKEVRTQPTQDGRSVEVRVWNVDPETERDDLTIPLEESGTGVGQVLAILYVVLTSEQPRTIIVDEPQSFLHPGALRRLIGIMKQHPRHQYILTTHAPSVITASDPDTLLLTRLEGVETKVDELNVSEAQDLRRTLAEVGARLSDVFGADNILWVEGRTEEECFPMILERVAEKPLLGTQILGVRQTGDLEGRQAAEAFQIYEKLSEGRGLRPPAVGFIFDCEDRSEQDLDDLRRRGDGKIRFIGRRMYENYVLNSESIAAVLTELDLDGEEYSSNEVRTWIESHAGDYDTDHDFGTEDWEAEVDGASLLEDLFVDLSDTRVEFEKVRDNAKLTEWLIENEPEALTELAELLSDVLGRGDSELA
jgi:ABC-type cobalamin/Fe3+-siderophores transport system ATPase subunit